MGNISPTAYISQRLHHFVQKPKMLAPSDIICKQSVGIVGTGLAGLITAHVLLQDGFEDVQLLTRDKSAGGVWARQRLCPDIKLNK